MKNYIFILAAFFFSFTITIYAQKTKLKVGDRIPHFSLLDQNGKEFNSTDYLGKKSIVLFFYPKVFAPRCTAQACSFRDNKTNFNALDAIVVGINPANIVNQSKFASENELSYPVLSDRNNRVKKMFGVPSLFLSSKPKRYTFIIDKNGIIQKIYYNKKNIEAHIDVALATLYETNQNEFSVKK